MLKLFFILISLTVVIADDSGTCGTNCQYFINSQTNNMFIYGNGQITELDESVKSQKGNIIQITIMTT